MINYSNRLGETNILCLGCTGKIIKYNSATDIDVEILESGEIINTRYSKFQKGSIMPKFVPNVYGVGFIGNGYSKAINGKDKPSYIAWHSMLERCYSKVWQNAHPNYIGCEVCKEWHCFETFEKWYDVNFYNINDERMCLDKDILFKGNKIYAPETCIFVPQNINKLFTKSDKIRGEYPIGVYFNKQNNKFRAQCGDFKSKTRTYLGLFNTPEEAFNAYKEKKESIIKEVADQYKDKIPEKLYNAMYRWEVEITD